jgi:hypothetical protein
VPSPRANRNIFANEVSCASASRCLFVGDDYSKHAFTDLAEAWNGTTWTIVTSSNPRGTTNSNLQDVSCPTVKGCLAVGVAYTGRGTTPPPTRGLTAGPCGS